MPNVTDGRTYGLLVVVVAMSTLSGCGILGGGGCGPGDTKIGDVGSETTQQISITGEVTTTGPGSFVVDDGTGKAFVMSGTNDVESGDCMTVRGVPTSSFSNQRADVAIAPTNVTSA